MMGAARDGERDPARSRPDHHALIRIGDLVPHLLHGARGNEGRVAADEGAEPRGGEARGHAHGVLLGDAHIDDALRRVVDEAPEPDQVERVGGDRNHPLVAAAELGQSKPECEARLIGRRLHPGGLGPVALLRRAHAGPPSSAMAFS